MFFALFLACAAPGSDTADTPAYSGPTYYRDVRPILDTTCARCHTSDGIAASFDDPAFVQERAELIRSYVNDHVMPPPAPDPDCQPYEGSERFWLEDADRATLDAWVDAGAPLGDEADAPAAYSAPTLAPWDLEIRIPEPYTPDFAEGPDDYRCFRLDLQNEDPTYFTGIETLIDNPRLVHHVVIFEVPEGTGDDRAGDGTLGFECGGFGEDGWDFVAGWAPGGVPTALPEGMGIKMGRDTHLVLQMHYNRTSEDVVGEADQSGVGLLMAEQVERQAYVFPLGTSDFVIPAGDASYESSMIVPWQDSYGKVEIVGVFPHMHQLGSSFQMYIAHPDATQSCLVDLDGWDFHNQVSAFYDAPVLLQGGDVLSLTCEWDNSAGNPNQTSDPPQDVVFGEGSGDEMCFGFTYGALAE